MRWIEVKGVKALSGSVNVPGSKNSCLALLAAACLADEPIILENVPDIADVEVIRNI